jgi:5-methylcytosine-specific restriction enzyme subunit McrC
MVRLSAWSSNTIATLTPEQARLAEASGLVTARVHEPPASWRLVAGSRVGWVGGEGWEIRVAPALAKPKQMFLLGYATDPTGWRDEEAPYGDADDPFAAMASGFALHATRALDQGPLRGYVSVDERAAAIRGRIRFGDQAARMRGLPLPLEITYDDFTADIHENRLLYAAATALLRFPRVPDPARARLRRIRAALDGVSPPATAVAPPITRLNRRYEQALPLAELILRHASVTTERGTTRSIAFVFDMNRVFEDFLSVALTEALRPHGVSVRLQHAGRHLDRERLIPLRPDITVWRAGRCVAVVDAKYKRLADARFPNADAYQMLAYCTGFALRDGTLVYAHDPGEENRTHHVVGGDTTVRVRTVDVQAEPGELLRQVDALAATLIAGATDRERDSLGPPHPGAPPAHPLGAARPRGAPA